MSKSDKEGVMWNTGIAKTFNLGRSQAVRLPMGFRLPADRVRVRRVKSGILLEPMVTDIDAWFSELDRFADVPFMEDSRHQPRMPRTKRAPTAWPIKQPAMQPGGATLG